MRKRLYEYLNNLKDFDASVLVVQDGEVLVRDGFGYADREKRIRNLPDTRHPVASITKSFTALSVLQLKEKGLLCESDPLSKYIPKFPNGNKIALSHLLTQKSGIVDNLSIKNLLHWDEHYTEQQIMDAIQAKKLRFNPGAKWEYSNSNYVLLSHIVEIVSGLPYHDYVKQNILSPAGMNRSGFLTDHFPDQSYGYRRNRRGAIMMDCHLYGCGDLVSTVDDLYLYHQALTNRALLDDEGMTDFEHPHYRGRFIQYGYGWAFHERLSGKTICHAGGLPSGYATHLERHCDQNVVIIVLCNNQTSDSFLCPKPCRGTWVARHLGEIMFNRKLPFYQRWI